VKNLIVIGEAIGFSTGVIRATLHDLQKENLIHSPRRSFYDINHDIFADQYEWIIKKHHFIDDWPDNFLAISYLSTPRHNQTLQKKRIEALTVFGFIEYEKNFFIRPNNLKTTVRQLQHRLGSIEPERPPKIFLTQFFSPEYEQLLEQLALHSIHQKYCDVPPVLCRWIAHADHKPCGVAAKEVFLMSRQILNLFYIDPLLPTPLVSEWDQKHFIESTQRFLMYKNNLWKKMAIH
jgi:phenylacetic acid degradation operon negative regulatory protein